MFAVYSLILFSFYRPQRSCDKVMFLHLSVILFTGRLADPPGQTRPLGRPQPSRQPQAHPLGSHPWADTPVGRHPPLCAVPAGIRSRSGRYASYWNAFLFFDFFFALAFGVNRPLHTHIYATLHGYATNLSRFIHSNSSCGILPESAAVVFGSTVWDYPHRGNRFSCASQNRCFTARQRSCWKVMF